MHPTNASKNPNTYQSLFNTAANQRYHYLHWGAPSKPKLIFIHGALANAYWFEHIAPHFCEHYQVICISLPGHGKSDWQQTYNLDHFLDIIQQQCLPTHPKDILIGHSLGARLSLYFLEKNPYHLRNIILLDPPIGTPYFRKKDTWTRQHPHYENAQDLIQRFRIIPKQPFIHPDICQHIAQRSIIHDANGFRWQFDPNFFNKIDHTTILNIQPPSYTNCNIHLIYGKNSQVTTTQTIKKLQEQFQITSIHPLENAWHAIMIDQPQALIDTIKNIYKTL